MNQTNSRTCDLSQKKCKPCEGGAPPLDEERIASLLNDLPGWELKGHEISKSYSFPDFYQTMAFVNAVAWIANREEHHPDLEVGYSRCVVHYTTHAIEGLSENDFICAAKLEKLLE